MSNQKTREREINSLTIGMAQTQVETGIILTLRENEEIQTSAGLVRIQPAWQWSLLEK